MEINFIIFILLKYELEIIYNFYNDIIAWVFCNFKYFFPKNVNYLETFGRCFVILQITPLFVKIRCDIMIQNETPHAIICMRCNLF